MQGAGEAALLGGTECEWASPTPSWTPGIDAGLPLFVGTGLRHRSHRTTQSAVGGATVAVQALMNGVSPTAAVRLAPLFPSLQHLGLDSVTVWGTDHTVPVPPRDIATGSPRSIAIVMIVQNEASRIAESVESIASLAGELVVVDGGSDDATPELAQSLGATVIHRRFDGDFAAQRNAGLEQVTCALTLMLDADETVSPELAKLLVALSCQRGFEAVSLPILDLLTEGPDVPWVWPDPRTRLFESRFRYTGRLHERLAGRPRTLFLPVNGPYLVHRKDLHRHYEAELGYAESDSSYDPGYLARIRAVLEARDQGDDRPTE